MDNRQSGSRNYLSGAPLQRLEGEEEEDVLQGKMEDVSRRNETGLPDNLKAGVESLSGYSLDDVRVHYNSSKPATVQALAYTQGTDIHVAPGQEKHLPHEAWHVAQQMAGRVSPTTNINGMPVNDNAALEHEADVMGEKALQRKPSNTPTQKGHSVDVAQRVIQREGEADRKFEYVQDIHKNQDRLPYKPTMILFAEYLDKEILSYGFSGCFMMAFHFNPVKTREEIGLLLSDPNVLKPGKYYRTFVAHVANDARDVFFDAVNRDLIIVEAMIRPHNGVTKGMARMKRENTANPSWTDSQAGVYDLTGGMRRIGPGEWDAQVYDQERVPESKTKPFHDRKFNINPFKWDIRSVMRYSSRDVAVHTLATKAYIYARVCLDLITNRDPDSERLHSALRRLDEIKASSPQAIGVAVSQILKIDNDRGLRYTGDDIFCLLMIDVVDEERYLNTLRANMLRSSAPRGGLTETQPPENETSGQDEIERESSERTDDESDG